MGWWAILKKLILISKYSYGGGKEGGGFQSFTPTGRTKKNYHRVNYAFFSIKKYYYRYYSTGKHFFDTKINKITLFFPFLVRFFLFCR